MSKLNLGAGNIIEEGYINHDLVKHRDEIELCFDLNDEDWSLSIDLWSAMNNKPTQTDEKVEWSSDFDGFQEIKAWDVIEHINDPINFMDNCWDLLKTDGVLHLKACGYQNESFYIDITHKKGYHIKSFDYFSLDTEIGKEYNYYTSKKWKFLEGYPRYDRKGNVLVKMSPVK